MNEILKNFSNRIKKREREREKEIERERERERERDFVQILICIHLSGICTIHLNFSTTNGLIKIIVFKSRLAINEINVNGFVL